MNKQTKTLLMMLLFLTAAMFLFLSAAGISSAAGIRKESAKMDREMQSKETQKQLYGEELSQLKDTDPDLYNITTRYLYGEVYQHKGLSPKMKELVTLVVLTTNAMTEEIGLHVGAALKNGATPVEIKETLYHCTPYIGISKVRNALAKVNEVFRENGIALPVESMSTVNERNRLENGIKVQTGIFGEHITQMRANAPADQKHLQDFLSGYCFGDFYTRGGLDLKQRELITFCAILTLGGCENQLRGHIGGNVSVGNTKETLLAALTQCMPYIGFPRTLNALACINEVLSEKGK
jgi:4-carboxymuconolactone decarboxylase